ncbi:hypothetical protein A8A57_05690 [Lelliottia amnigena]|nr:hypothetical protein A8A57_05690 [Lelliottia amnigena]
MDSNPYRKRGVLARAADPLTFRSALSEKRTFEWFSKQVGVLLTWLRINNKGQVTLGYSEYQKWFV